MFLILQVRIVDGSQPSGDYAFAKYNKVHFAYTSDILLCVLVLQSAVRGANY